MLAVSSFKPDAAAMRRAIATTDEDTFHALAGC
jgi:hypothetical protein